MGEEVRMSEYRTSAARVEHEERVMEWEMGLPAADDLTPLSHQLIPPELASAFSISLNPSRTLLDVTRASETTLSNINLNTLPSSTAANNFKSFTASADGGDNSTEPMVVQAEEEGDGDDSPGRDQDGSGSDTRNNKLRKLDSEEADSAARNLKRARLVWTPQLHKRFVEVVAHLGIKNAVPKTIMQLMNVEGLTRENVASHLQKYRLYLKRMQGSSSEGGATAETAAAAASSSHHQLFASTPVPQSFNESTGNGNGNRGMPMQTMAYHQQQHHHHPMGMQMYPHSHHQYQNGFDHGSFNYGNGYAQHHNHHHHHQHQVGSNDNNVM